MATKLIGTMADNWSRHNDRNVIREVEAITSVDDVKWSGEANITLIGADVDSAYTLMVKELSVYIPM